MTDFTAAREAMVDCQVRPSDVTKYPIIAALLEIQRERFVPQDKEEVAYAGEHLDLGNGRWLLDPRTFAKMLDAVNIGSDDLVLDIGSGLGYSTMVLSRMAQAVVGVEQDQEMATLAESNLADCEADNAAVVHGPLTNGHSKHAPYDIIVIEGAVETIPAALADQLKEGGRIAAILNDGVLGQCKIGFKTNGQISWREMFDATAPLLPGFEKTVEFSFAS